MIRTFPLALAAALVALPATAQTVTDGLSPSALRAIEIYNQSQDTQGERLRPGGLSVDARTSATATRRGTVTTQRFCNRGVAGSCSDAVVPLYQPYPGAVLPGSGQGVVTGWGRPVFR